MKTELLTLSPQGFCEATNACREGRIFAERYKTMADVWDNCPRADWLVWILNALDAPTDDKAMRLFACWCARETPMRDGRKVWDLLTDERSRNAVTVAERYAKGLATEEELRAAYAAYAAYDDAYDDAYAAAYAADPASAYAASVPAAADTASAYAAYAAAVALRPVARAAAYDDAYAATYAAAYAAYAADTASAYAYADASNAARLAQANELRRVIPNPFRA